MLIKSPRATWLMHWPVADTGRAINATTSTGREQGGKKKAEVRSENGTEAEINWGRPLTGRLQLNGIMALQPATESRQSGANQRLIIGGGTPKIA